MQRKELTLLGILAEMSVVIGSVGSKLVERDSVGNILEIRVSVEGELRKCCIFTACRTDKEQNVKVRSEYLPAGHHDGGNETSLRWSVGFSSKVNKKKKTLNALEAVLRSNQVKHSRCHISPPEGRKYPLW